MEYLSNSLNYILEITNLKKKDEKKFEKPQGYKNINSSQMKKS